MKTYNTLYLICNLSFSALVQDNTLNMSEVEPVRKSKRRNTKAVSNNLGLKLDTSENIDLNLHDIKGVITRSHAHDLDVSKTFSIRVPKKKKSKKNNETVKEDHNVSELNETKKKIVTQNKNLSNIIQSNDNSFSSDKENMEVNKPKTRRKKKKTTINQVDNDAQKESFDNKILTKKTNKKSRSKNIVNDELKVTTEVENEDENDIKGSNENIEHNSSKDTTFHSVENHDKSDKSFNSLNDTLQDTQIAKPQKIASFSLINDSILDKASSTMIETHIENEKKKGKRMPLRNIRISGIEELAHNETLDVSTLKRENTYVKEDKTLDFIIESNISTVKRENTYVKEDNETLKQNGTVNVSMNTTRNVFQPAKPCSIFKKPDSSTINISTVTPPRVLCKSVSFGSAGCTPRMRKSIDKSTTVDRERDGTPKSKARPLNLTHSMEKPENNHYVKDSKDKTANHVTFVSSPKAPSLQNISVMKSNMKGSNKITRST